MCRKIIIRYNRPDFRCVYLAVGAEKTRQNVLWHDVAISGHDSEAEIDGQSIVDIIRGKY